MSTPLMPELPPINAKDCIPYDLIRYLPGYPEIYVQKYAEAYGLAVWKAAIEAAAATCEEMRDKALSAQHGRPDDLQNVMLRQVGHVGAGACAAAIRSLPLPEQGGPK